MKIDLNEIVDPFGARVVVRVDAEGHPEDAWFDLVGLPRVDALLVGQPVTHAPTVVERLCGICPAAHHLAGVRALEALAGQGPVPPTADAVRRLLHLGSALETHAVRFVGVDREAAVTVRRAGRAAMAASGSPGHFPATAVPGGVRAAVDPEALAGLRGQVADAVAAARAVADALASDPGIGDDFAGADVALVDAEGRPDLLGEWVRAVAPDGRVLVEAGAPQEWPRLVAEERPGAVAPRPYLTALGPGAGWYRVGPVAQLRIGVPRTPQAADLRERWLAGGTDGVAVAGTETGGVAGSVGCCPNGHPPIGRQPANARHSRMPPVATTPGSGRRCDERESGMVGLDMSAPHDRAEASAIRRFQLYTPALLQDKTRRPAAARVPAPTRGCWWRTPCRPPRACARVEECELTRCRGHSPP